MLTSLGPEILVEPPVRPVAEQAAWKIAGIFGDSEMSHPTIVRVDGEQAGIAIRLDEDRFRFFSALAEASPVEGGTFGSIAEITDAVRDALATRRSAWPEASAARASRLLRPNFA